MSSWGYKDNLFVTGNVTTSNASPIVNGFGGTKFLIDIDAGDYIFIAANKYQVQSVESNVAFTLTANAATNSANVKAYVQQGPKYVSNIAIAENVYTIQRVYGVNTLEANISSNREKNIKQPGWYHYHTYTDALGNTRYKAEVLVAMSKDFTEGNSDDAADDAIIPES